MMHYRKGENIEQELTKDDLPFADCLSKLPQKDFLWMHVRGGTKVPNVINYAKNALDNGEYRTVVWSGVGGGVVKTVSCAEILKRSYPLYQLTRMDQVTNEEHWVPQMEGLEPILAKRKVPSLHILMTLDPIDESIGEIQKPNTTTEYWRSPSTTTQQQRQTQQIGQNSEGLRQRRQYEQKRLPKERPQSQVARQEKVKDLQRKEQSERQQISQNPNKNRTDLRHNNGNGQHRQQRTKRKQSAEIQQQSAQATQMEVGTSGATSAPPTNISSSIDTMES
ncbi:ribonuclease P protein subunit p25-like protein [Bactrocera dorsalis]|uniref:Ribonuclease P protein subunit p25-like protein n=1 Tax=Bactrocera dorsalis TaxID=27457 RepID=A0A6I9VB83_BACDO|nr:ribonuclease P protein subunit p25-like protein [Bactrocera dorsalis]